MLTSAGAKQFLPLGEQMGQGCPDNRDFFSIWNNHMFFKKYSQGLLPKQFWKSQLLVSSIDS